MKRFVELCTLDLEKNKWSGNVAVRLLFASYFLLKSDNWEFNYHYVDVRRMCLFLLDL